MKWTGEGNTADLTSTPIVYRGSLLSLPPPLPTETCTGSLPRLVLTKRRGEEEAMASKR